MTIIDTTSLYFFVIHHFSKENNLTDDFNLYKQSFDERFQDILNKTNATEYLAFDDIKPSFRHKLFDTFKSNRNKQYFKFKEDLTYYARNKWSIRGYEGLESDDLTNIAANLFKDSTICHIDGDLNQIVGNHFNYRYDSVNPFYTVTKEEAGFNLFKTILTGGHNNTKGLAGCGEGSVDIFLKEPYFANTI